MQYTAILQLQNQLSVKKIDIFHISKRSERKALIHLCKNVLLKQVWYTVDVNDCNDKRSLFRSLHCLLASYFDFHTEVAKRK